MRTIVHLLMGVLLMASTAVAAQPEPFMSLENPAPLTGVRATILTDGLDHPWGMAWLPDGGLLITQRSGGVKLLKNGELHDVPGAPPVLAEGQGGLLDIALHPDFAQNGLVYFTLATGTLPANRTALVRTRYDGEGFGDPEVLFHSSQTKPGGQHFGSRLVWLPDGTLVMSVGDGGNPPIHVDGKLARTMPQNPHSHLGKILRLKDDGSPVDDPAFADRGGLPEIYTAGHRNIQGLAYDPIRDTLWATEHGARGGDEVNRIEAGKNYGWPKATYSRDYVTRLRISEHNHLPGMVDPLVVWIPSIAPSGLCVYTGEVFADWKGNLLAGGLRARTVRRILLDESGRVTGEQALDMGARVRDVRQGPDGLVYVLTDEDDGRLIRLEPSGE